MAKDKVGKEEKKLPAEQKKVKQDAPVKEEKKKENKKWHAMPPVKSKCSCRSVFQDLKYGLGVRLHNIFKNGKRCTVCGTEKV